MMQRGLKKQTVINFLILCPIFLVFSLLLSSWRDAREMDFATYWQAGRAILSGQNVYNGAQWQALHQAEGIVIDTGRTFFYPLPLAALFFLPALLPIQAAYTVWMFLAQIAILVSIINLLSFYPARSGYLELLAIAGIFFFRPMFSIINSGQIVPFLLLPLTISIRMFHDGKWFAGGVLLSVLSLKPSLGFPLLILTGLWLVCTKQWKAIGGMVAGGFILVLIGALMNYRWIPDYLNISEHYFRRYFGVQPILWGVADRIFEKDSVSLTIGFICVAIVLMIETYLFVTSKSRGKAFEAFASIVPAALLVAPYLWTYDQTLLIIPIIFLLINITANYGLGKAALFMFGIVALAFGVLVVAYNVGHDVWSFLNSFVVWIFSLYFVVKNNPLPTAENTG